MAPATHPSNTASRVSHREGEDRASKSGALSAKSLLTRTQAPIDSTWCTADVPTLSVESALRFENRMYTVKKG